MELIAIGAGPSNLALAVALEELAPVDLARGTLIVERYEDVVWQRGMLLPWTQSQVSFLKDLVTLRNPRSEFSFVNYLHSVGRLDEFINLGSFTPYRLEISGYLLWVARSLPNVRISYGRRCVAVQPRRSPDGGLTGWLVTLADGATIGCRDVVVGAGRDPHIPEVFGRLPAERIIHSTEYAERIAKFDPEAPLRVAVIGGAQSAAEMLWATHQRLPHARCTMVMRSIGLNAYESSKFTNELYYPSFVDQFHGALPDARAQLLREMHRTNYAGLAPAMLDTLYRQIYLERLTGTERIEMITMAEVSDAWVDDNEDVVLALRDRMTGAVHQRRFDAVLLGTGFVRRMPRLVRDLARRIGLRDITVDRHYRLELPPSASAACYLQGVNEDTHGIADSLLSVLAARSGEIAADILSRRRATDLLATIATPHERRLP